MEPDDRQLEAWHRQFSSDHQRLKQQLLEELAARRAARDKAIAAERLPSRQSRWLIWTAIAASLVVVAGLAGLFATKSSDARSFTILDLPEVLRRARSIYVRGGQYHHPGFDESKPAERYPLELYFERPGRYWHTHLQFHGDSVSSNFVTGDGERYAVVFRDPPIVIRGADLLLDAQMYVENGMQNVLGFSSIGEFGANGGPYQFVGAEIFGETSVDVYEQRFESLPGLTTVERIWIDPRTGHPIKSLVSEIDADGRERKILQYDSIEIDGPPPERLFNTPLPDGGQQHEIDKEAWQVGQLFAQPRFTIRYALSIDGQALLYCWSSAATNAPQLAVDDATELLPTIDFLGRGSECPGNQEVLRIDRKQDQNWLWVLVTPADPALSVDDCMVRFAQGGDPNTQPNQAGVTDLRRPLRFEEPRLLDLIPKLAQTTDDDAQAPEAQGPDTQLTLDRLRSLLKDRLSDTN